MKLLNKILLAIDFEQDADEILEMGKILHNTFHSRLYLIHVLPERLNKQEIGEMVKKAAFDNLASLKDRLYKDQVDDVETLVRYGSAFDQVINAAEELEVNVILAGTGGKKSKDPHYFGTTVEKIIRKTVIPVWVVRPNQEKSIQKILCPVDFSEPSMRALNNAIMLARKFKAKLDVLSVFEPETTYSRWIKADLEGANRKEFQKFKKQYDDFLLKFDFRDVEWEKLLLQGSVDSEIIMQCERSGNDLVVMGTTGRTGLSRIFLGSVAEKVLREVPCSVITTKSQNMLDFHFEMKIDELAKHYEEGVKALENNEPDKALSNLYHAFNQDIFHVPTLVKMSEVYNKMGKTLKANQFKEEAKKAIGILYDDDLGKYMLKHYGLE